ncbi:hypothetical protein SEA_TARSUSIV_47 [Mycobacterium phage TarsusIV]|nr:hypothetical protein SEA_TARSUSIV_47 [Mycobacterium phage TarsusIV]
MPLRIKATLKDGQTITADDGEYWDDGRLMYVRGRIKTAVFQTADLDTLFAEEY